jgi:hypothetical protein
MILLRTPPVSRFIIIRNSNILVSNPLKTRKGSWCRINGLYSLLMRWSIGLYNSIADLDLGSFFLFTTQKKSPRANYTDRATAACRRSDSQLFADRGCHVDSVTDPYGRYFFYQAAPQLYSRGWVDPVPDPLLFFFSGQQSLTSHSRAAVCLDFVHLSKFKKPVILGVITIIRIRQDPIDSSLCDQCRVRNQDHGLSTEDD